MFRSTQHGLFLRLHGKVQGVGMRKTLQRVAASHKINGYVWNHKDGSVCLVACGKQKKLNELQIYLVKNHGDNVTAQLAKAIDINDFKGKLPTSFNIIASPFEAGAHARVLCEASGEAWRLVETAEEALSGLRGVLAEYSSLSEAAGRRAKLALEELGGRFPKSKQELRALFAEHMPAKYLPHGIVAQAYKFKGLPQVASFKELITLRARKQHIMPQSHAHEWVINNKLVAYQFVDSLNLARPQVKDKTYTVADIPKLNDKIIKPLVGQQSIGVFMMKTPEDITEVATGMQFDSLKALKERMRKLMQTKQVRNDEWLVEELIYGDIEAKTPPRDFKFLVFFGKVELVREINRLPKAKDCWWDRDGNPVDTGEYLADEPLAEALGINDEMIKLVESVSRKVPVPFLRIDFLLSDGKLVFNEFTPRPGSYAKFNDEIDRKLGDAFLKGESRLVHELVKGKKFPEFKAIAGLKKK